MHPQKETPSLDDDNDDYDDDDDDGDHDYVDEHT